MTLTEKVEIEIKFGYVSDIVAAERALKELKSLYAKHLFDSLAPIFKSIYESQALEVKHLKAEYREKYGKA